MNTGLFKKNFTFSVINMAIQFLQSLWVTSFIQRMMGIEAYGYIAVIVNIVNMAGIITVALTSVCSKYIVIELEKKDYDKIEKIINTIYFALIFIAGICIVVFSILVINMSKIINISAQYIDQVSILMIIVGADFIVQLLQVFYLSVFYYEEKLYYGYYVSILSNIAKIFVVVIIFQVWRPVVWGAYIGSVIVNGTALKIYNMYFRKHYPNIQKNIKYFDFAKLKDVLGTGIWVSLSKLAATLLSSCSTYLVNILIGVYMAGIYGSIAQIQSILSFITVAIVNIFLPQMYKIYAEDKKTELVTYTAEVLKVISIVLGIVAGGLIVFGDEFMSIWISEEYLNYNLLLIISICYLAYIYSVEMLNQLLITIDKTKIPALISIIAGVINIIMAVFFVKVINMGIYGIAVAQMIILCIRSGIVMPVYAAYCMEQKWYIFLIKQCRCIESMVVTIGVGCFFNHWILVDSWTKLFFVSICSGFLAVSLLMILDGELRRIIKKWINIE